jgi:hypothetical protein
MVLRMKKLFFTSLLNLAHWIGKGTPGKRNSVTLFLILLTLTVINCVNEFDYPQTIQVTGTVTY